MRTATVFVRGVEAGWLHEEQKGKAYSFTYQPSYQGPPVSLTMPIREAPYSFDQFPPFFDGLLPEGSQLDGLLRIGKIDADDYFQQLLSVGNDLVGAVTVKEQR